MRSLALYSVLALGGALAMNAAYWEVAPEAQAQSEPAASIIAVQIRKQGFTCDKAQSASRVSGVSRPDLPVWHLDCGNATYRVELVPNMAAKVERLN